MAQLSSTVSCDQEISSGFLSLAKETQVFRNPKLLETPLQSCSRFGKRCGFEGQGTLLLQLTTFDLYRDSYLWIVHCWLVPTSSDKDRRDIRILVLFESTIPWALFLDLAKWSQCIVTSKDGVRQAPDYSKLSVLRSVSDGEHYYDEYKINFYPNFCWFNVANLDIVPWLLASLQDFIAILQLFAALYIRVLQERRRKLIKRKGQKSTEM